MMFADYKNGLLQVTSAFRKYVGLETYHDTDKDIETWLNEHQFKKVMFVLIDGMGSKLIERYLPEDSFIRTHMIKEIATLFPPTTSAVTTSVETGKSPAENGWIGWNQYFKELDTNLILFYCSEMYGDKKYPNYVKSNVPIRSMCDEEGVLMLASYGKDPYTDTKDFVNKLLDYSKKECRLIYGYYDNLDSLMHKVGVKDAQTIALFEEVDCELERLSQNLDEDCALIMIADHGQVDVRNIELKNYPDIVECLYALPSLEPRCVAFHVKDEYKNVFKDRFNNHFKDDFKIFTKEEVLKMKLFGTGTPSVRFEDFIGDFIAITDTDANLGYDIWEFHGSHAGATVDEMMIPVVLYPKMEK